MTWLGIVFKSILIVDAFKFHILGNVRRLIFIDVPVEVYGTYLEAFLSVPTYLQQIVQKLIAFKLKLTLLL